MVTRIIFCNTLFPYGTQVERGNSSKSLWSRPLKIHVANILPAIPWTDQGPAKPSFFPVKFCFQTYKTKVSNHLLQKLRMKFELFSGWNLEQLPTKYISNKLPFTLLLIQLAKVSPLFHFIWTIVRIFSCIKSHLTTTTIFNLSFKTIKMISLFWA